MNVEVDGYRLVYRTIDAQNGSRLTIIRGPAGGLEVGIIRSPYEGEPGFDKPDALHVELIRLTADQVRELVEVLTARQDICDTTASN